MLLNFSKIIEFFFCFSYITEPSTSPLVILGEAGCGKSVLSSKIAYNIHSWLPSCGFVLRYIGLTPLSSDLTSLLGLIAEQLSVLIKGTPCIGPHVSFYSILSFKNHQ